MEKKALAIMIGKLAPKKEEPDSAEAAKLDAAEELIRAVKDGDREAVAACLDDFYSLCDSCEMDSEEE